ncbi:DUF6338 family protein [Polyangium sorediatum]|uniref:DUF6338 family protein n=1 Tax=Polyangium sorediatum TaxID=889274 RepID=A0ABT6PAY9_9BACT|nr:DUF6338 family protein [Polyangium sorediatum]MDI1437679.1 DUF6338 family protein [Polyangium sorediatum]
MDIEKVSGVIYLIAFGIPGFIAQSVFNWVVAASPNDDKGRILSSFVTSAWLYAFASPSIYYLLVSDSWRGAHPRLFAASIFALLFLYPFIAGYISGRVASSKLGRRALAFLGVRHPNPRAWDRIFSDGKQRFVLAELTDGSYIGGLYSGESFAGDDPSNGDLYLELQYKISNDDQLSFSEQPIGGSGGVYIERRNIKMLRFYECNYDSNSLAEESSKKTWLRSVYHWLKSRWDRKSKAATNQATLEEVDDRDKEAGRLSAADTATTENATLSGRGLSTPSSSEAESANSAEGHGRASSVEPE